MQYGFLLFSIIFYILFCSGCSSPHCRNAMLSSVCCYSPHSCSIYGHPGGWTRIIYIYYSPCPFCLACLLAIFSSWMDKYWAMKMIFKLIVNQSEETSLYYCKCNAVWCVIMNMHFMQSNTARTHYSYLVWRVAHEPDRTGAGRIDRNLLRCLWMARRKRRCSPLPSSLIGAVCASALRFYYAPNCLSFSFKCGTHGVHTVYNMRPAMCVREIH